MKRFLEFLLWLSFLSLTPRLTCSFSNSKAVVAESWNLVSLQMISSGFTFSDGEQILISAQKPLGIVLEQDSDNGIITVAEVLEEGSAGKAGVQVGDILVAAQNASTENVDLDSVLDFIANGPRVINLRLLRNSEER